MPDSVAESIRRGRADTDRGRYRQAIRAFESALHACPQSIAALHGLAVVHERCDELDPALECCDRALSVTPDYIPALLTKGSVHARRGERMTAMEAFRTATRLNPDYAVARHLLATTGGGRVDAPSRDEVVDLFDDYAGRFDGHLVNRLGYTGHFVLPEAVARTAGVQSARWVVVDLGCGTGLCGPHLRPLARCLIGVDVSPGILAQAKQRGIYDVAYVADLVYALAVMESAGVDLMISADVLCYVGDLAPVLAEAARVLRDGGRIAFTVETCSDQREDYVLSSSRRFAFSAAYLRRVAGEHGFAFEELRSVPLRRERGKAVLEHVVVLRKSPSASSIPSGEARDPASS